MAREGSTSMDLEDLQIVKESIAPKRGKYYFGDKQMHIIKSLVISVNLRGRKVWLHIEVVEGDIPWLLGKRALEKMRAILDIG